ncbi:DUF3071 domain-containing protein [Corynebacterium sp. 3HC-13]|uniref:septation protein SepH n=1 Tax=Corynebacterium poyangense TaxID=2684405 RepID=UPI001CCB5D26|nr:septation protein SepH [Corynebacterium poyangense]MBZ8176331.1 DUF3071 domain-containing protein [Corynebacterium poyangense]
MRELFLVREESTPTSLVFRPAEPDSDDNSGTQFFLEVTPDLRAILLGPQPESDATTKDSSQPSVEPKSPSKEDESASDSATELHTAIPNRREPDPALSAPLTMRPREIQERIRSGASVAELAETMGVAESRVEAFAYPVLQERSRIAEMAKQSHPVRDDGPAKLTLFEVLATALAARGHDLAEATWDAFRETSGQWVVTVTWRAGLSENTAEWTLHNHTTSSATAVARNGIAADLTDPNFVQPVRTLTPISRWDDDRAASETMVTNAESPEEDSSEAESEDLSPTERTRDDIPAVKDSQEITEGEDLLQHPDPEHNPTKRRRRAVTPHWEDVLLGVRANTKRPRK